MLIEGNFLEQILTKRGITSLSDMDAFLNPDYQRDLHDAFKMGDMNLACDRLYKAINEKEKIVIYADYDCDGIPGAVVLVDLLKLIGFKNYEVYIPQRNSEGYGLNMSAIEQFIKNEVKLLITIDLGITAIDEVKKAKEGGIDVVITDHHLPPKVLPGACAILNPKIDDYPEKMLCGAGVVFKFVQGFIKKYGELYKINAGAEKWMLDMVGIATLSDMVPLTGENRTLAYFGMKVLRKTRRKGLVKLLTKMNIDQKHISEDDIGFMLAPRLNAASRMDDPMRAYELLSTDNNDEAEILADHLTNINDERKSIVASIMRELNKKFKTRELDEVIVIGNPEWRVGVLGLVAGKLCDEYKKPVFVWGRDENNLIKGSCRSDGTVSVVELMADSNKSFLDYGGHEMAGGFTVHADKIHSLESVLSASYLNVKRKIGKPIFSESDVVGELALVNIKNWKEIEKLSPFGLGNPKPVFLFDNVFVDSIKKFGKNGSGEHLEIIFRDKNSTKTKAISFFSNTDSFKESIIKEAEVSLLATFDLSRFRGREELRLRIIDILPI